MTRRHGFLSAFSVLVIVVIWLLWPDQDRDAVDPADPAMAPAGAAGAAALPPLIPAPLPAPRSTLADGLNAATGDIHADLRVVSEIIDGFRTNFPRLGNPVGDNQEITAVLTGRNRLHLALIPPDHPAINPTGQLCDRWGTPFFFHAESATRMEIRSAGPDRKMWNDDDVVYSP